MNGDRYSHENSYEGFKRPINRVKVRIGEIFSS